MLDVGPAYCESNRRINYSALVCRSAQVCLILIGFFQGWGVVVLLLFSSFPFISSFSIFSGGQLYMDSFLVLSQSFLTILTLQTLSLDHFYLFILLFLAMLVMLCYMLSWKWIKLIQFSMIAALCIPYCLKPISCQSIFHLTKQTLFLKNFCASEVTSDEMVAAAVVSYLKTTNPMNVERKVTYKDFMRKWWEMSY